MPTSADLVANGMRQAVEVSATLLYEGVTCQIR